MIPSGVIKEADVKEAIKRINRDGVPPLRDSTGYYLSYNGKLYPPKLVVSYAFGHRTGTDLPPKSFKTGYGPGRACAVLKELGFDVEGDGVGSLQVEKRNPQWAAEELVLAVHYYLGHPKNWHSEADSGVIELSKTLRNLALHPYEARTETFRNPVGVALTLNSFKHFSPNHKGKGAKPSRLAYEIWEKYGGDFESLAQVVEAIVSNRGLPLSGLGLDTISVELLAFGCLVEHGGKCQIGDIYKAIQGHLGQPIPPRAKPAIREAVNRSYKRTGLIKKASGAKGGWELSDSGQGLGETWSELRTEGCSVDELLELEWSSSSEALVTEKVAAQVVRIKQDVFRRRLLKRWEGRCAVTGLTVAQLLRASHIRPWHISDDRERIDPENGLLLSVAYDAAFDKGLVTFDDHGCILLSRHLAADEAVMAGIDAEARIRGLSERNRLFLDYHRRAVFER